MYVCACVCERCLPDAYVFVSVCVLGWVVHVLKRALGGEGGYRFACVRWCLCMCVLGRGAVCVHVWGCCDTSGWYGGTSPLSLSLSVSQSILFLQALHGGVQGQSNTSTERSSHSRPRQTSTHHGKEKEPYKKAIVQPGPWPDVQDKNTKAL